MRIFRTIQIVLVVVLFLSACKLPETNKTIPSSINQTISLPLSLRTFFIGTSGFGPANSPGFNINDLNNFWRDVRLSSEIYGIHVDWQDTKLVTDAAKILEIDFEVVLGFQNPTEWENSVGQFITAAANLLTKHPQIKYLGIGNEVNIFVEKHPDQFDNFIEAYKRIYSELKTQFPNVKLFTTFQYEALRGEAFLMGKAEQRDPNFNLIDRFGDQLDLIGLTLYPYMDIKSPNNIPIDYFQPLKRFDLPLAITGTGWMARTKYSGTLKFLSDEGYAGSEKEQVEYLKRLLELTETVPFEFINWFFINDYYNWENGDAGTKGAEIFDSDALKYHDGTEKQIWQYWLALKQLDTTP